MMGPLISSRQLGIVEDLVKDAKDRGGNVVCGGERMKGKSNIDELDLGKGLVLSVFTISSAS